MTSQADEFIGLAYVFTGDLNKPVTLYDTRGREMGLYEGHTNPRA